MPPLQPGGDLLVVGQGIASDGGPGVPAGPAVVEAQCVVGAADLAVGFRLVVATVIGAQFEEVGEVGVDGDLHAGGDRVVAVADGARVTRSHSVPWRKATTSLPRRAHLRRRACPCPPYDQGAAAGVARGCAVTSSARPQHLVHYTPWPPVPARCR